MHKISSSKNKCLKKFFNFFQQDAYEDPEKEDPTVYVSEKTHRGPLTPDWLEEHWPKDG